MLDKIKVDFKEPECQEVIFGKHSIKVIPYISEDNQAKIGTSYLERYFDKKNFGNVITAEHELMLACFILLTNIDMSGIKIDDILGNYQLWEAIKSKIKNYGQFRASLAETIKKIIESERLEKSLGSVVESLFDRLSNLLNSEISPETIEKTQDLLKQIENSPVFKKASEIYREK